MKREEARVKEANLRLEVAARRVERGQRQARRHQRLCSAKGNTQTDEQHETRRGARTGKNFLCSDMKAGSREQMTDAHVARGSAGRRSTQRRVKRTVYNRKDVPARATPPVGPKGLSATLRSISELLLARPSPSACAPANDARTGQTHNRAPQDATQNSTDARGEGAMQSTHSGPPETAQQCIPQHERQNCTR
jgi:hypothetical protein